MIEVAELGRGAGTYEFDYLVYGQRAGKEGYRVVRPRDEGPPEEPTEAATEPPRVADTGDRADDPPPTADRLGRRPALDRP